MRKLSKSELLSEYKEDLGKAILLTDSSDGHVSKFYHSGKNLSVIQALPEDVFFLVFHCSGKVITPTTFDFVFSYYSNDDPNMKMDDLIKLEDRGTEHLIVYAPKLDLLYKNLIKKMYSYEVSPLKVKRMLGKDACKLLSLLGKDIKGVWQHVNNDYYCGYVDYSTRQEYEEALSDKVKSYKDCIKRVLRKSPLIDYKSYSYEEAIVAFISAYNAAKKQEEREKARLAQAKKKAAEKFDKIQRKIVTYCDDARLYDDIQSLLIRAGLRLGENRGYIYGQIAQQNNLVYREEVDYNGYSRRCQFTMIRRSFILQIQKGYRMRIVGGLLTFYRGKFSRDGMAVEWIQQGRSIADITKHTGFLVRGEHIQANSLREAKRINADHRAMKLARLLNIRKRVERREEMKANGSLMITFSDSLKAGNCRPGTQEFKNKYEAAIGHEAKSISIKDLRKYAKEFGVSYYAEQAIDYAINH